MNKYFFFRLFLLKNYLIEFKNWFLIKKNILNNLIKSIICERFFKYHYLKPVINGKKTDLKKAMPFLYGKTQINCACNYCNSLFLVDKKNILISKGIFKL